MAFQFAPFWTLLVLATFLLISLLIALSGRQDRMTNAGMLLVLASVTIATGGYVLELVSTTFPLIFLWVRIEYFGLTTVGVVWLLFISRFLAYDRWMSRRRVLSLFVVPLISLILVWTSAHHHLFYTNVGLKTREDGLVFFNPQYGPFFWVNIAYNYLAIVAATGMIIQYLIRNRNSYARRLWPLLWMTILPWLGNFLNVTGLSPFGEMDLTIVGFAVAFIVIAYSLFGLNILDTSALAREAVVEIIPNALITLDENQAVLDLNRTAQRLFATRKEDMRGRDINNLLSKRFPSFPSLGNDPISGTTVTDNESHIYNLLALPLGEDRLTGWVISLEDVTATVKSRQRQTLAFEMGQQLIASLNPSNLLSLSVQLLIDTFGFYHVQVYLVDSTYQNLVLAEVGGKAAEELKDRALRIPINTQMGITTVAARNKEPVILQRTRDVKEYLPNPMLPEVRSEVAIPIILEDRTLGVLDILHDVEDYFTPDELQALSLVASQLATALTNARLFEQAEEILRELYSSEARYRVVVEDQADLIARFDRNGVYTFVNEAYCRYFDVTRSEVLGKQFVPERLSEESVEIITTTLRSLSTEKTVANFEHSYRRRDGDLRWLRWTSRAVLDQAGEIEEYQNVGQDVTEERRAQAAERDQRQFAEALGDSATALNSIVEGEEVFARILEIAYTVVPFDRANIVLLDDKGTAFFRQMIGYEDRTTPGQSDEKPILVEDHPTLRWMIETRQTLLIENTRNHPLWAASNTEKAASFLGAPIIADDQVLGCINLNSFTANFYTQDHAERVTAFVAQAGLVIRRAMLFEQVNTYARELEERNMELDAFSYTVAHDFNTALARITSIAELFRSSDLSQMGSDLNVYLKALQDSAYQMSEMTGSLLLLSRLRDVKKMTGKVEMERVVMGAVGRFLDTLEERGVHLEVNPGLPAAWGYAPWLEEVFANLIGNALKYLGEKNSTPRIIIQGKAEGSTVRYEVIDNGLGISKEDQKRLFEMFSRFHTTHATGYGLGLSIVHRIVRHLGGTVGVTSTPGGGSTFWFIIPAYDTEAIREIGSIQGKGDSRQRI